MVIHIIEYEETNSDQMIEKERYDVWSTSPQQALKTFQHKHGYQDHRIETDGNTNLNLSDVFLYNAQDKIIAYAYPVI